MFAPIRINGKLRLWPPLIAPRKSAAVKPASEKIGYWRVESDG